ncbi:MAG: urease accessory protein [Candidatus Pseudothioglobus sp.]|jgi:urease accessory protein
MMESAPEKAGWIAELELSYAWRFDKTRLLHKRQLGPLTIQRSFYPEGDICHSYLIHPPGGVVGGDQLSIDIGCEEGAAALITTPGATKFYRSSGNQRAHQSLRLTAKKGASLEWLPQQNIFFPGARVDLETDIHIEAGGQFIGWEMHCFGRPVIHEKFSHGSVHSCTKIWLDDALHLVEHLITEADEGIKSPTGLRGNAMQGSLLAAPVDESIAQTLRDVATTWQASNKQQSTEQPSITREMLVGITVVDKILVVRALGEESEAMLQLFAALWTHLRPQTLGRPACPPRIWAT